MKRHFFILILCFVGALPATLYGQWKSVSLHQQQGSLSVAAEEQGTPERGRFTFVYSYSGTSISPTIELSLNGGQIASLGTLSSVQDDTLTNSLTSKGNTITLFVSFGEREATALLHTGLTGYPPGFWAGFGSITFFEQSSEGTVTEVFGTMDYQFYLTPPWNGIDIGTSPEEIVPGESSEITFEAIEASGVPVIVPEVTDIQVQTDVIGQIVGGLSLPAFGLRYISGFSGPYGTIKGTQVLYEAYPDSVFPSFIEFATPSIIAYNRYNTSINGQAFLQVSNEEEEENIDINFFGTLDIEISPTLKGGSFSGQNTDKNNFQENIIVEVTKNGEPFPNKEVILTPRMILPSGGHDHQTEPSELLLGDIAFDNVPITDQLGVVLFDYKAPRFSGIIELTASVAFNGQIYETVKMVTVKISGLNRLIESDYFELVGAPDNNTNTNDPCRPPSSLESNHFSNHYGTLELNNAIRAIAKDYNLINENTKLRINDMSLEWGGLFDVNNNWLEPHSEHAIGKQGDIGLSGIDENTACVDLSKEDLLLAINIYTNEHTHSESDHYHIRVK